MDLAKWLADQPHGALSRLKRATGLSYNTVHAICTGKRPPTYASALAISLATEQAVSVAEVYAAAPVRTAPAPAPVAKPKRKRVKRTALKRRATKIRKLKRKRAKVAKVTKLRATKRTRTAKSKKAAA